MTRTESTDGRSRSAVAALYLCSATKPTRPEAREPSLIRWTDHAAVKAALLGSTRSDVEASVLEHHSERRANAGAADWTVRVRRLVVACDYPDHDDVVMARCHHGLARAVA